MEFLAAMAQKNKAVNQIIKPSGTEKIMAADDISTWYEAVQYYEAHSVDDALKTFERTKQNAKMLLNIGCCHLRRSDLQSAEISYIKAITKDQHFALGYYYLGLTQNFLKNYEQALASLDKTLTLLRGHKFVDYRQLGYNYQLYSCEILTDIAAVHLKLNNVEKAKECLEQALEQKAEKKHERIAIALQDIESGNQIKLFVPPKSEIFRPLKAQVANVQKKDFIAKAKVISTEDEEDCFACFSGIKDKVVEKKKVEDEIKKKADIEKYRIIKPAHLNEDLSDRKRSVSLIHPPKSPLPKPKSPIPLLKADDGDRRRSYSFDSRPNKPLPVLKKPEKELPTLDIGESVPSPVDEKSVVNECPVKKISTEKSTDEVDVEIEYRFVSKLKLPKGFSIADLQAASVQQVVPKQMEFRIADRLGRQTTLTEEQLSSMKNELFSQYSILCYPATL